jgi:hypothetical protein
MKISVYDVTGKLVFQEKNIFNSHYSLNLSNINSGIYFLKIIEGNKQITKRLMIK